MKVNRKNIIGWIWTIAITKKFSVFAHLPGNFHNNR